MRRRRWRGTVVSGNLPAAVLVPEPGAFSFNVDASFSVWRADSQSNEGNTDCDINRIDYRRSLPDWFRADVGDIYRHQIRSVRYCGRGLYHIGRCSPLSRKVSLMVTRSRRTQRTKICLVRCRTHRRSDRSPTLSPADPSMPQSPTNSFKAVTRLQPPRSRRLAPYASSNGLLN